MSVNELKELGEEVKDKDFFHKFLRCLPSRFGILVTILVRSGLDNMTPNQVLGDVMTNDTCRTQFCIEKSSTHICAPRMSKHTYNPKLK